jgi:predicted AAA+ superfamily ATPase
MILRKDLQNQISVALRRSRIVALIGPRQCGKTTLAREWLKTDSPSYFDLEDPTGLARLEENPMEELKRLKGLAVIDEIQRRPDLFSFLRVLADRRPLPAKFLILGSSSPELIRKSSESLAGRLETVEISGFAVTDVGIRNTDRLWLRGGLPPAYLARSENDSLAWRKNYVRMFLERDIPQMGISIPAETLRRFWSMVAHYHGQIWNAAEPASAMGISEPTVRRYLDLLEGMFMVRQLRPWHENLKKRQVKAPKVYLRDTGLLHYLLGIQTRQGLLSHPKAGASWEGFVIEEVLKKLNPGEA